MGYVRKSLMKRLIRSDLRSLLALDIFFGLYSYTFCMFGEYVVLKLKRV